MKVRSILYKWYVQMKWKGNYPIRLGLLKFFLKGEGLIKKGSNISEMRLCNRKKGINKNELAHVFKHI